LTKLPGPTVVITGSALEPCRPTAVVSRQTSAPARSSFQYRPELDGLRAVAVLAVLAFHGGFGCPGGFVGVDVFFVLSGFLISTIVREKISEGRFSLVDFWERRIRRLAAASVIVIAFVIIAGWWILLPKDYQELGQSIVAQALLAANFYFWRETGYFAGASELKPLLHLWSLAVEEQFYLILPPLLMMLKRVAPTRQLLLLGGVGVASFAWCVWATPRFPESAFFLLPSRAWEMLLGVVLTYVIGALRGRMTRPQSEAMSLLGLTAILVAIVGYSRTTPFPGVAAALPCLGTAAIILGTSTTSTGVGRLLAVRPMVFIGLISYSLYLWHWPLLSFLSYMSIGPAPPAARFAMICAAFGLAAASFRWIEAPIRSGRLLPTRSRLFGSAAASMTILAICGVALHVSSGSAARFPPNVLARLEIPRPPPDLRKRTLRLSAAQLRREGLGYVVPSESAPALVVIGDSHADALLPVVAEMCAEYGVPAVAATRVATLPLLCGESEQQPDRRDYQQVLIQQVLDSHARHVLIVGRWGGYTDDELTAQNLQRTIRALRERDLRVWLLRQVPEQRTDVPRGLALAAYWGWDPDALCVTDKEYATAQARTDGLFAAVGGAGVRILDPAPVFFAHESCLVEVGGHPLFVDDDHVSLAGALALRPILMPIFDELRVELGESAQLSTAR